MRIRPNMNHKKHMGLIYLAMLALVLLLVWMKNDNQVSWTQQLLFEGVVQENAALIKTKMMFIEAQYQKKLLEVERLKAKLKEITGPSPASSETNPYYEEIVGHMKNFSDDFEFVKPVEQPQPLQAALSYTTMRHLLRHPKARCPAFQILSPRKNTDVDVVIGIPTVKREKEIYIYDTIQSLIEGMTEKELSRTLIIVFIGEATDLEFVADVAFKINFLFKAHFGQLIEVISPTKEWYPDWSTIVPTLGDSKQRTLWRTKQNLDGIFLMSYAQNKGTYYLMLEDDIVATKGYMTEIMKYTAQQSVENPNWFFIEFSKVGGFGKFYKTEDLAYFNAYVQVFYLYMPIDWLIEVYLDGRACALGKTKKECETLKLSVRPRYKKAALFEHAGVFSSLRGKVQKVKDFLETDTNYKKFKSNVIDTVHKTQNKEYKNSDYSYDDN